MILVSIQFVKVQQHMSVMELSHQSLFQLFAVMLDELWVMGRTAISTMYPP